MSGQSVSYNLRPNKFVERHLFVELIRIMISGSAPENYLYVSLGGPQLEDQKLVHHDLGITSLISLESDETTYQRQVFDLRPWLVQLKNDSTGTFVRDFDSYATQYNDKEFIVWFDYASPRQRREQLKEYERLLSKLQAGDVLKITLNASIRTLGDKRGDETEEDVQRQRLKRLQEQLNSYLPQTGIEPSRMTNLGLIPILLDAVKVASFNALKSTPTLHAVPIAIFSYQDSEHQMLTIAVRLTKGAEVQGFKDKLQREGWRYLPSDWTNYTPIKVPNLTVKERLYIEERLFSDTNETIHSGMPFRFDADPVLSLAIFEEYAQHYRRYPSYFQVVL